jgi:protein SCO1/2
LLAAVLVTAAGILVLGWASYGFRAATTEGARRLAVAESPRLLPPVELIDQQGRPFRLDALGARAVVVDFFYTRCTTVCGRMAVNFRDLRERLGAAGADVALVSVSFDAVRDTPSDVAAYAEAVGADPARWRIARADAAGLPLLLEAFGIIAVPDGVGGFVHNAAIHVVDSRGRLARIFDVDQVEPIARFLEGGA